MKQKIVIIALGYSNSGKSMSWYTLLAKRIKTGWKELKIRTEEIIDVFVINGSMEERDQEIEDIIDGLPDIVFCSVQYIEHGIETIEWFKEQEYYLYIQWLNPGYYGTEYEDYLNFETRFSSSGIFHQRSGKEVEIRCNEIRDFLLEWTK